MKRSCSVIGAYGRRYKDEWSALTDFIAGKDFILKDIFSRWDNKPCSIRDLSKDYYGVEIRYGHYNENVTFMKMGDD